MMTMAIRVPDVEGSIRVGDALTEFLSDQVLAERARKSSLEARALGVITSSGVLVTLLMGLGSIVVGTAGFRASLSARALLVVAAAMFVIAAALAIFVNAPLGYLEVEPESLRDLAAPSNWILPGEEARRQLAAARLEALVSARRRNQAKALVLLLAAVAEVFGGVFTACAAGTLLL